MIRLPANIYIMQLIISRHLITSEFYALNEAIFLTFIHFYDILALVAYICPNTLVMRIRMFILGFILTGRPCLMALICVERYVAVVQPLVFLRFKQLMCKLVFCGIIWLATLASCCNNILMHSESDDLSALLMVQIMLCFVMKLYCCIATLLALKRPGPGEGVQQRQGLSNTKLKAFRIILTITLSVILLYGPVIFYLTLKHKITNTQSEKILKLCYVFSVFSEFVQMFLFLQRSGKRLCVNWP